MVDPLELKRRAIEIEKILGLQDDNIPFGLIPEDACRNEPFCNYKAVYQKENNAVFINPHSFDESSLQEMTAYVAHELYHAYQHKTDPQLFDTQETQNYHLVGIDYIKQPLEMQAYAFQVAISMLYEEAYLKFELEGVDDKTTKEINDLAEKYYEQYKDKFIEVVLG